MLTLTQLAEQALPNAKLVDAYIPSKGLAPTSLNNDTLTLANLPPDMRAAQRALADASQNMKLLARGSVDSIIEILYSVSIYFWHYFFSVAESFHSIEVHRPALPPRDLRI